MSNEVNWLEEQESARGRMNSSLQRGDYQAYEIARREFDFASSRMAGTAIYGEDFWDNREDCANE